MKLTVLVDNNTLIDRYFVGEPALSFFIEDGDKRILFDVGYSDAFIKNAQKMGIDLLNLDHIVLSHGHLDHTWGLAPLISLYTEATIEGRQYGKPRIVAHPSLFHSRKVGKLGEVGSLISKEQLARHFALDLTDEPRWLTDNLVFLGQIPRHLDFEGRTPIGKVMTTNGSEDDYIHDDSALAYKSPKGLVIISGCAHSGICNTIEYAKEVTKVEDVADVIGGFHLLDEHEGQLMKTSKYIASTKPLMLHPCHCTSLKSKMALSNTANVEEVGVGLCLEYD